MSTVQYNLEGDSSSLVSSLEAAIRELAKTVDKATEAKEATRKLTEEQRKAAEEAKKASEKWGGLGKILKSFGGDIAGVTDTIEDLGEGLDKMIPALGGAGGAAVAGGVALAGLGLAATGVISGLIGIARAAGEAGERLGDMRADDVRGQVEAMDDAWDRLTVSMATSSGGVLGTVEAVTGLLVILDGLVRALGKAEDAVWPLNEAIRVMLAGLTGGASEALRFFVGLLQDIGDDAGDAIDGILDIEAAMKKLEDATKDANAEATKLRAKLDRDFFADFIEAVLDEKREFEKGEREKKREAEEFERFWKKSVKESAKALEDAEKDKVRAAEESFGRRMDLVREEASEAKKAIDASQELAQQQVDLAEEAADDIKKAMSSLLDSMGSVMGSVFDGILQEMDQVIDQIDARIAAKEDSIAKLKAGDEESDKANAEQIEAEEAQLKKLQQLREQEALKAFNMQKASSIAQITMQTGIALITALAQLGPVAGAFAAGGIIAAGGAQIAVVAAQKPPLHDGGRLHDGGADEMMFGDRTVRQGEAAVVFNQRAVQSGALEQAATMNRGGGESREVRLVLGDAGRTIGEVVLREGARSGSALRPSFGSASAIDPYRSR